MRSGDPRAGFFDVEEQAAVGPTVTALLVVRDRTGQVDEAGTADDAAALHNTCAALVAQTLRPDRVVVVDSTQRRTIRQYLGDHDTLSTVYAGLSVVMVPPEASFAAIVDMAVDALPPPGEDHVVQRRSTGRAGRRPVRARDRTSWLWLLHEDTAPDADALEQLTDAVVSSTRVGVAGCKVLDATDPSRLVDIGTEVTRTGRHLSAAQTSVPDQGQYDDRRDVLSVNSAGMLVRQDTYNTLGGFDPAFDGDGDGDGLDLGWRAHLIGHSVVVVPSARVCGQARGAGIGVATLRRHRQVAMARSSLLGMPLLAAWTVLSSLFLAVALLVVKRPREAGVELAQATAPFGLPRILGARSRFFRRATTRRHNLRGLFVSAGPAARAEYDAVFYARPGSGRASTANSAAPPQSEPTARSSGIPGGLVVVLLAIASAVWFRAMLTSGAVTGTGPGFSGGQLLPFHTDAAGIWATYRDAWVGPGLGNASTPAPYLAVLAPIAWLVGLLPWVTHAASGAVTVAWILLAAMPLSGLVAYRAGRVVTTDRWPRAVVALLWGVLPTLTTAVAQGRLGPVVGHILLPFALAATLAAARRGATVALTFGAVLAVAVTGAFAPALLLACSAVALGGIVVAPGRGRWRQLAILVTPWLLLAPWTRAVVTGDHRLLLAGPGSRDTARGALAQVWQLALLHPGGPGSYAVLASIPVLAIGVLGLLRPRLGRSGVALIGTGLLGLAAAIAAPHLLLTDTASGVATPWTGPALDVYAFALLAAALFGIRGLGTGRLRPWVHSVIAIACVGACAVGGFAVATVTPRAVTPATSVLPSVVDRQLTASRAPRALVLGSATSGLTYQLIGREAGQPTRDLRSPDPAYDARTAAVARSLDIPDRSSTQLLHQLAVSYVVVRGASAVAELDPKLSASGAVTRLTTSRTLSLWRVLPITVGSTPVASSRLTITQAGRPATEVGSTGAHGRARVKLPAGPAGRALVLAEGAGWTGRGRVTLNGRLLSASVVQGWPTYVLPTTGGTLRVDPGHVNHRLSWLQLIMLIGVVYLAVPFGTRARRS